MRSTVNSFVNDPSPLRDSFFFKWGEVRIIRSSVPLNHHRLYCWEVENPPRKFSLATQVNHHTSQAVHACGSRGGGQYLTVSAAKGPLGRAARLLLPLGHLLHAGDLCLSFRHKVTGLHSGTLQVFVRKHGAHGAALWGRNGGHGWRQTHITLRGADIKSVIFKGEKRHGHTGEIGLDDVSLKKGHCSEEREQLQN